MTELVNDWGAEEVLVGDSSFNDNPIEAMKVSDLLKNFGLPWHTSVRWAIRKEFLEYIMECGCYRISIGMESGSDRILKLMRKGASRKLIREKTAMLRSTGIHWHLYCIVGFPTETLEDMEQTLELALEIQPTSISLNSFSPLPGTELYDSVPEMSPFQAAQVNQLHPARSFAEDLDIDAFRAQFDKMLAHFDVHNRAMKTAEFVA